MSYDNLLLFMNGGSVDAGLVLKDIETFLYIIAKKVGVRLNRDTALDLCSILYVQVFELEKPVPSPQEKLVALFKRAVYSSISKNLPIDVLANTQEEAIECFDPQLYVAPIQTSLIHPSIREVYTKVVYAMPEHSLERVMCSNTFLGQLLATSVFAEMGSMAKLSGEGYSSVFKGSKGLLPFSGAEEEVLLGVMLARVGKKWAVPLYVLMRASFYVVMFSILGDVMFSPMSSYFRNLYFSVKVHCVLRRYREIYEEKDAIRLCSKKFNIRQRDVRTRDARILRMLEKYDRFSQKCVSQIIRDSGIRNFQFRFQPLLSVPQKENGGDEGPGRADNSA